MNEWLLKRLACERNAIQVWCLSKSPQGRWRFFMNREKMWFDSFGWFTCLWLEIMNDAKPDSAIRWSFGCWKGLAGTGRRNRWLSDSLWKLREGHHPVSSSWCMERKLRRFWWRLKAAGLDWVSQFISNKTWMKHLSSNHRIFSFKNLCLALKAIVSWLKSVERQAIFETPTNLQL